MFRNALAKLASLVSLLFVAISIRGEELPPVGQWIPADTPIMVEVSEPMALLGPLLRPEFSKSVMAVLENGKPNPKLYQLQAVVASVELQLGTDWRTGLRRLAGKGLSFCVGLLVDDSKTELHHLSALLAKRGFEVRTAENGEDAMKRLGEEKPDLILMDVVMPGQNGFQLTRAITRDPRFSGVPVIMCTSKNQETDKVWGMRQGARDYIVKPIDPSELLAKIRAFD